VGKIQFPQLGIIGFLLTPDAWIDHDKTRIGYEIPFNCHFYVFEPPRPLAEIDADLKRSMDRIKQMIEGLAG